MKRSKRTRLEAAGWAVGSVKEFLGLSEGEAVLIEMKLALSRMSESVANDMASEVNAPDTESRL